MTDPHAMRDMAGRFEVHAQTVEDVVRDANNYEQQEQASQQILSS
ncbi:hypothetical protein [Mycobacterium canetti]|nr:hypothetical protein [Mycobacterium canetti]